MRTAVVAIRFWPLTGGAKILLNLGSLALAAVVGTGFWPVAGGRRVLEQRVNVARWGA